MNTITNIPTPTPTVFDDADAADAAEALRRAWLDGTIPDPGPAPRRAVADEQPLVVCHGPRVRVASWRERWTGRRC